MQKNFHLLTMTDMNETFSPTAHVFSHACTLAPVHMRTWYHIHAHVPTSKRTRVLTCMRMESHVQWLPYAKPEKLLSTLKTGPRPSDRLSTFGCSSYSSSSSSSFSWSTGQFTPTVGCRGESTWLPDCMTAWHCSHSCSKLGWFVVNKCGIAVWRTILILLR